VVHDSPSAFPQRSEWLERCKIRLRQRDDLLHPKDVLELAGALWDRPSCRALEPERAADLLFEGGLNPSTRTER